MLNKFKKALNLEEEVRLLKKRIKYLEEQLEDFELDINQIKKKLK
jgi:hypothetical protein